MFDDMELTKTQALSVVGIGLALFVVGVGRVMDAVDWRTAIDMFGGTPIADIPVTGALVVAVTGVLLIRFGGSHLDNATADTKE